MPLQGTALLRTKKSFRLGPPVRKRIGPKPVRSQTAPNRRAPVNLTRLVAAAIQTLLSDNVEAALHSPAAQAATAETGSPATFLAGYTTSLETPLTTWEITALFSLCRCAYANVPSIS
jgi:hypothetical protein